MNIKIRMKAILDILRGKSFMTGDIEVRGGLVTGAKTSRGVVFTGD